MIHRFADPWFLTAGVVVPLLVALYYLRQKRKTASLRFPSFVLLQGIARPGWTRHLPFAMRIVAIALLIVAFARPQSGIAEEEIIAEGIDIVLALDMSSSMLAEDIEPNRFEAARAVAKEFVQGRVNDRVGLVVFAAKGYTQCPLTLDYDILFSFFDELEVGLLEDGTAIGSGLATAVNRLRESDSKSRIIVLLTDGRNNRGEIDPQTAADLAKTYGIKVYTVGAGSQGLAPFPVRDPLFGTSYTRVRVDIDEETLKTVADKTGGRYFRATDRQSLQEVYQEIDRLEKTEIEVNQFTRYGELFHIPLLLAAVLLFAEQALASTLFRRVP